MASQNPAALEFLATRRSVPPKVIAAPAPGRDEVTRLLALAARVPDHGMLVPWRFVVLQEPALRRIGAEIADRGTRHGIDAEAIAKATAVYATSPLAVAVVAAPVDSDKIPAIEQSHSAGAVCLSLLNAALASGWAAGWVTGWVAHDRRFLPAILGLTGAESIVGLVHIGTAATPPDRPRPDIEAITTWAGA